MRDATTRESIEEADPRGHEGAGIAALDEPRPVCVNPSDCCRELSRVWTALGVTGYTGLSASEHVTEARRIAEQLIIEATKATNALASVARAQYQHAEVARLHIAIGLLKDQLAALRSSRIERETTEILTSANPLKENADNFTRPDQSGVVRSDLRDDQGAGYEREDE